MALKDLDDLFCKYDVKDLEDLENRLKHIAYLEEKLETANTERHEEWKTGKEWKWAWQKANRQLEQANQDKISFCIEQLEKVKKDIIALVVWELTYEDVLGIIDNQIKQLKEGK